MFPIAKVIPVDELITEGIPLGNGVEDRDLQILATLARDRKRILEIGTMYGRTTLNLANTSPPDAVVTTVDIDMSNFRGVLESRQIDPAIVAKIDVIEEDSRKFDFAAHGPWDYIFVDGWHSTDVAYADSVNAYHNLVEGGILVWHDFSDPGVCVAINALGVSLSQMGAYLGFTRKRAAKIHKKPAVISRMLRRVARDTNALAAKIEEKGLHSL